MQIHEQKVANLITLSKENDLSNKIQNFNLTLNSNLIFESVYNVPCIIPKILYFRENLSNK